MAANWLEGVPIVGTFRSGIDALIAYFLWDENKSKANLARFVQVLATAGIEYHEAGSAREFARDVIKGLEDNVEAETVKITNAAKNVAKVAVNKKGGPRAGAPKPPGAQPKKRGEHIINNNVTKLYKNIIDKFVYMGRKEGADMKYLVEGTEAYEAYHNSLPVDIRNDIMYHLKVHINEVYADANTLIYGRYAEALVNAVVAFMIATVNKDKTMEKDRADAVHTIKAIVKNINEKEIFLDPEALKVYKQEGGSMQRYERAKGATKYLFSRLVDRQDQIRSWARELTGERRK